MYKLRQSILASFVARCILAIYLLGIGITSVQACTSIMTATAAFTQSEMPACHQHNLPNKNACQMHCLQNSQTANSQSQLNVEGTADVAVLVTHHSFFYLAEHSHRTQPIGIVAMNAGPPIPILYCRFLN